MRRILGTLAAIILCLPLSAQEKLHLDVDTIMRGPGLSGYSPKSVRWARDGESVYFEWKRYSDPVEAEFDTYVAGRDGKGLRKLTDDEAKDAPPEGGSLTRDQRRTVYVDDGDVFLYDAAAKRRRALTSTTESESGARFTRDEKHVAFVRSNNLFVLSLDDGSLVQRTNIVAADEKGPHVSLFQDENKDRSASQKVLAEEAVKLSDVLARREAEKKREEAKRKAELRLEPLKLAKGESVSDLQLSGDGGHVIVLINVEATDAKKPVVPSYVTASGYTTDLPARTKAGDSQGASRVGTISTTDGKVQWVKTGLKRVVAPPTQGEAKTDSATEQKTSATAEKTESDPKKDEEREVEYEPLLWSEDGAAAVLRVRAADNKDRWLLALDPATATTRVLAHEHDDAWVHWFFDGGAGFVPGTRTLWFISEQSGWLHLYTVPFEGGTPRAITSGKYEVDAVQTSLDGKSFFVTTSRDSLFERHLYRVPVTGGAMTKLTAEPGWHNATVSPDGATLADVYSYTNKPEDLYVDGVRATVSPSPEFASYPWLDVPIVHFTARDGAQVPAHLYEPPKWNGGPAVIFVHGAGYLQNIHRGWSNYYREYMFHHLLMERGYLVIDIDYRASSGYGRDWRTAIYRHMGGVDLDDHVDAAKWLVKEHRVDPKRIGIYGGSYGGFIALMGLFTTPDVFAAGAALRPVTDWAHYNHGYTSNILNTPQTDPEAYRRSSPIYFAGGLKGALLICHGVIDVNVNFQDTVRLAQRLIELRKENWEVAMYPLEDHGFVEPTSWADEYKRVLKLFETRLGGE